MRKFIIVAAIVAFFISVLGFTPANASPSGPKTLCYEQVTEHRIHKFTRANADTADYKPYPGTDNQWVTEIPEPNWKSGHPDGQWALLPNGETRTVNGDEIPCEDDEPEVSPCDTSAVKGGVKKWLADNGIDPGGCFGTEVDIQCGTAAVSVVAQPQPGYGSAYRAVWLEGDVAPTGGYKNFPATFDEDHNGGSVTISWFLVGPEKDWLTGSSIPNFWDGTHETIVVNTDCEDAPPPPPPPVTTDTTPTTVPGTETFEPTETETPATTAPGVETDEPKESVTPTIPRPTSLPVTGGSFEYLILAGALAAVGGIFTRAARGRKLG